MHGSCVASKSSSPACMQIMGAIHSAGQCTCSVGLLCALLFTLPQPWGCSYVQHVAPAMLSEGPNTAALMPTGLKPDKKTISGSGLAEIVTADISGSRLSMQGLLVNAAAGAQARNPKFMNRLLARGLYDGQHAAQYLSSSLLCTHCIPPRHIHACIEAIRLLPSYPAEGGSALSHSGSCSGSTEPCIADCQNLNPMRSLPMQHRDSVCTGTKGGSQCSRATEDSSCANTLQTWLDPAVLHSGCGHGQTLTKTLTRQIESHCNSMGSWAGSGGHQPRLGGLGSAASSNCTAPRSAAASGLRPLHQD